MIDHYRRTEDVYEPKTDGELIRATYRSVIDIKSVVFGNGKPGLCDRMTIMETTVKVLAWVVGAGLPTMGLVVGWIFYKR